MHGCRIRRRRAGRGADATEGAEMLVKTYYSTGHLDVFDAATLTDLSLFKGNVLTDYALEVSVASGGKVLWLDLFYYEAAEAYEDDMNSQGLPVARCRDGWSCVLADEGGMTQGVLSIRRDKQRDTC